ncbi:MAG: glycine cleavage system aminomethyltransferase GcvT [Planctomycetes bacterium]|nr:glycine cleavage system aminomethyltransferase GcvT [Planctomycetota bacterium]NOG55758.1 glycine cleavage system aminomethyltransferase GcvT [Planctomycetota bacterium]
MLHTPFYDYHISQNARMVDFAGWQMPIMYTSIVQEHEQVRTSGGMFDVSHMGRVYFRGQDARRFLERICTRRISNMAHGQCRYSLICNEQGGVRDDVLVYRMGDDDFMLVVNAANRTKLLEHFRQHSAGLSVTMDDRTEKSAMLAIQGPRVMDVIGRFSDEIPSLKKYRFTTKSLLLFKVTVSRTGYTGEDGVEVILPANVAPTAIKMMLDKGGDAGQIIKPIGLGARDTLRLEAGMPLYGHEMGEETDPISAGLMFGINLDKDEHEDGEPFIGQDALKAIHANGPTNRLVGLFLDTRRTARQDMPVLHNDGTVGRVTSGCTSPTLERSIAMAYVPAELTEPGTIVQVDLGKQAVDAEVCALPFYKRPKPVAT